MTEEWVADYAKAHWKNAGSFDHFAQVGAAIKILRIASGIKTLLFESALVDPTVPRPPLPPKLSSYLEVHLESL